MSPARRLLLPALALAALLCREAARPGRLLGVPTGEAWGRSFVTNQLGRWLSGSPLGTADLLGWPGTTPLWPIDPALQLVALPAELLLGPGQGLVAAAVVILTVSGWATGRLALRLGASLPAAAVAGLLVEAAPYLLRNLQDAVVEAAAIGFAALAAEQIVAAHQDPGRRAFVRVGLSVLLLSLVSPYYTVYLALGCALALPWTARRAWLGIAAASAVACGIALLPLLLAELGTHGRFASPGGYQLDPGRLVTADGGPVPRPRLNIAAPGAAWLEPLRRAPGGLALLLSSAAAALLPGGRRWAGLGAVFFLAGPGVPMLLRAAGVPGVRMDSPLQWLLAVLPVTESLGNPSRLLAPWILLTAVGFARAASRRPVLLAAVAAVALAEMAAQLPGLKLPSTPAPTPPAVLAALSGPTVVFPSGDYPLFHPQVAPKEALFLAGVAQVPIPQDYGRWRIPADLALQRALSAASGAPLSERALDLEPPETPAFVSLLVLEDRLTDSGRERLSAWLTDRGAQPLAAAEGMRAWRLSAPE